MYPFDFQHRPAGFEPLENEPIFDPARHLQLERPQTVYGLDELGYSEDVLRDAPASFAATSVFRILSDEGAALLYDTVKRLEDFCTSNPRIARKVNPKSGNIQTPNGLECTVVDRVARNSPTEHYNHIHGTKHDQCNVKHVRQLRIDVISADEAP